MPGWRSLAAGMAMTGIIDGMLFSGAFVSPQHGGGPQSSYEVVFVQEQTEQAAAAPPAASTALTAQPGALSRALPAEVAASRMAAPESAAAAALPPPPRARPVLPRIGSIPAATPAMRDASNPPEGSGDAGRRAPLQTAPEAIASASGVGRAIARPAAPLARSRPPAYPLAARQRGLEGLVLVRATIGADGALAALALARSSGHVLLDEAALNAVRKWRFAAAQGPHGAQASELQIPIRFRLDE